MIGSTHQSRWPVRVFAAAAFVVVLPLGAQNNAATTSGWNPQQVLRTETYVKPPADVERIIMAPRVDISFTTPSPDRKWFLRAPGMDRGDIEDYGKPHIILGGVQIDTKANRARSLTTSTKTGLTLVDPRTQATKTIETPKGASISAQTWSPNGAQVAYIANFDDASHIFVGDVASGKSVQVTKTPLLATLVTEIDWTPDGKSIVTVLVPDGRGPAPTHGKNGVEDGPSVRLTESRAIPQVIHPSLLEDPHDKAMLKYYTTGQLALIDVKSKTAKKLGEPAMIRTWTFRPTASICASREWWNRSHTSFPCRISARCKKCGTRTERWSRRWRRHRSAKASAPETPTRRQDAAANSRPRRTPASEHPMESRRTRACVSPIRVFSKC
jgi:hypothetical protein